MLPFGKGQGSPPAGQWRRQRQQQQVLKEQQQQQLESQQQQQSQQQRRQSEWPAPPHHGGSDRQAQWQQSSPEQDALDGAFNWQAEWCQPPQLNRVSDGQWQSLQEQGYLDGQGGWRKSRGVCIGQAEWQQQLKTEQQQQQHWEQQQQQQFEQQQQQQREQQQQQREQQHMEQEFTEQHVGELQRREQHQWEVWRQRREAFRQHLRALPLEERKEFLAKRRVNEAQLQRRTAVVLTNMQQVLLDVQSKLEELPLQITTAVLKHLHEKSEQEEHMGSGTQFFDISGGGDDDLIDDKVVGGEVQGCLPVAGEAGADMSVALCRHEVGVHDLWAQEDLLPERSGSKGCGGRAEGTACDRPPERCEVVLTLGQRSRGRLKEHGERVHKGAVHCVRAGVSSLRAGNYVRVHEPPD